MSRSLLRIIVCYMCRVSILAVASQECSSIQVDRPAILGKDITFRFTHPGASEVIWQYTRPIDETWSMALNSSKHTLYREGDTFIMVLKNSDVHDEETMVYLDVRNVCRTRLFVLELGGKYMRYYHIDLCTVLLKH